MAFVSVVASAMHAASETGALCKLSIAGRGLSGNDKAQPYYRAGLIWLAG